MMNMVVRSSIGGTVTVSEKPQGTPRSTCLAGDMAAREAMSAQPHGLTLRESWPKSVGKGICIPAQRWPEQSHRAVGSTPTHNHLKDLM